MLVYHESHLGVMAFKETTQYITAGSVSSYEDKNREDAAFCVGSFSSLPTPPVSSLAEVYPDDTRTARGIGAAKQLRSGREGRKPSQTPHGFLLWLLGLKLPGQSRNEMALGPLEALLHPAANELSAPSFFKALSQTHVSASDKVYL